MGDGGAYALIQTRLMAGQIADDQKRVRELEAEVARLRDVLQQARDLIADQLAAPHHLATIDAALAGAPSRNGADGGASAGDVGREA
jgi:hypothetical protein